MVELIPLPDHDDVPHQEARGSDVGLSFGNDQPLGPLTDDELMNIMKEQRDRLVKTIPITSDEI